MVALLQLGSTQRHPQPANADEGPHVRQSGDVDGGSNIIMRINVVIGGVYVRKDLLERREPGSRLLGFRCRIATVGEAVVRCWSSK